MPCPLLNSQLQALARAPVRRGPPPQVCRRALEQALPYIRLAEEQLDVLLGPVARREGLQEHHDLLEVHLEELVGPLDQEGGADVEVELGEAVLLGLFSRGR